MKLGYLGPAGSYSYEAACLYQRNSVESVEYVAMPNFAAIIDAVEHGRLDSGIIPVENSTHGAVATAMDMLLNLHRGTVYGEIILNVEHCLLSTNQDPSDLKYVYSHEQALEQCRRFLSSQHPQLELLHCSSTSQACALARQGGPAYGAIASKTAAKFYDLLVAAENIQDNSYNQTRFLFIGSKGTAPTGLDKTSIVFAFPNDCPGSLYNILKLFADRGINLTRIESRPAKHLMGKYIFYIDFLGHDQDDLSAGVLQEINGQVCWLKVLGSYPRDTGESKSR